MSITNERLRNMANGATNSTERKLATELLAARARLEASTREVAGYQRLAKEAADAEKPGLLVLLVYRDGPEVRIFGPDRDAEQRFGQTLSDLWKLEQVVADDLQAKAAIARAEKAEAELHDLRRAAMHDYIGMEATSQMHADDAIAAAERAGGV